MSEAPAYWLSALAEELAQLADNRDSVGLSAMLRQHAKYHAISEPDLTMMVRNEWERMGIVRAPISGFLRGWAE